MTLAWVNAVYPMAKTEVILQLFSLQLIKSVEFHMTRLIALLSLPVDCTLLQMALVPCVEDLQ